MNIFSTSIRCLLLVVLCTGLFAACKKDKGPNYKVSYMVTLEGNYAAPNPVVSYRDGAGAVQTETLTPGTPWKKEFGADLGFDMFVTVNGTFGEGGGDVELLVESYKGSQLIESSEHSVSNTNPDPFALNHTGKLEE